MEHSVKWYRRFITKLITFNFQISKQNGRLCYRNNWSSNQRPCIFLCHAAKFRKATRNFTKLSNKKMRNLRFGKQKTVGRVTKCLRENRIWWVPRSRTCRGPWIWCNRQLLGVLWSRTPSSHCALCFAFTQSIQLSNTPNQREYVRVLSFLTQFQFGESLSDSLHK